MSDIHASEHLFHHLFAFSRGNFKIGEGEFHIFKDIQLVNQVEALEDESDIFSSQMCALALFMVSYLFVVEVIISAGRIVKQAENI